MAKVSMKSEKITPFGGIFHVREHFSRFVGPVIDKVLGLRCTSFGYQYSEIVDCPFCSKCYGEIRAVVQILCGGMRTHGNHNLLCVPLAAPSSVGFAFLCRDSA